MTQLTSDAIDEFELEDTLTAHDRCDSCGAQAYVRVTLETGELLFCAHHGAKYKEKLAADRAPLARRVGPPARHRSRVGAEPPAS